MTVTGPAEPAPGARPMRAAVAVLITLALVAVAIGVGVAIQRAAHPTPAAFAACRPQPPRGDAQFGGVPALCIDLNARYQGTISTTKGTFTFLLLPKNAPLTVNNFIVLSRAGFYNGQRWFAITDWFVKAGDPQATGAGGPGYTLDPETAAAGDKWVAGSMGMARLPSGLLNGSQFFVLKTTWKGGDPTDTYNHFGNVTQGLDVVGQLDSTDRILRVEIKQL